MLYSAHANFTTPRGHDRGAHCASLFPSFELMGTQSETVTLFQGNTVGAVGLMDVNHLKQIKRWDILIPINLRHVVIWWPAPPQEEAPYPQYQPCNDDEHETIHPRFETALEYTARDHAYE